jgi:hypothetical protein
MDIELKLPLVWMLIVNANKIGSALASYGHIVWQTEHIDKEDC